MTLLPFFRKYDLQKRKCLDMSELSTLFKDLGEHVPQKQLEKSFAEYDKNGNGVIDFDEFTLGTLEFLQSHKNILDDDDFRMPDIEKPDRMASVKDEVSLLSVYSPYQFCVYTINLRFVGDFTAL